MNIDVLRPFCRAVYSRGLNHRYVGRQDERVTTRFVGQVEAKFTELNAFTLAAEGGARLWINGIKVIDRWADASFADTSASVELVGCSLA